MEKVPGEASAFIALNKVCKTYQLGEVSVPVLHGVTLRVDKGEMVALMGASGSGKTTLMNILGCLDSPTSGEYWFENREVGKLSSSERARLRNEKIGFVFQNFNLLPRTSALDNVLMPLNYAHHVISRREELKRGTELLRRLGLSERMHHYPSQLSGGQQQRVAIARALVNNPTVLYADEPTGNLDSKTSKDVLGIFEELNAEGMTVVLVTHEAEVAQVAKRVIRVVDGQIKEMDIGASGQETSSRQLTKIADGAVQ